MKKYFYVFLIIFYSCQYNVKTGKKNLIPQKLTVKEVEFKETFDVLDMSIVDDYLVVTSSLSDTLIHIYSLPDLKLLNKMGLKGDSPSDLAFTLLLKGSSKNIFIGGFNGGRDIREFEMKDKSVNLVKTFSFSSHEPLNDAYIINDSTIIYNSIFDLVLRKINLINNASFDIHQYSKDDHQESFFYSNKGKMGVNEKSIVYAYFYKDQIDFMDLEGKLITKIKGRTLSPIISLDNFDRNYISYVNLYAGKTNFYLLYRGQTHAEYKNNNLKDKLEVYNYEGEISREYIFEIPPIIFAVDEKRNVLYGYNGMYKDVLLVYNL